MLTAFDFPTLCAQLDVAPKYAGWVLAKPQNHYNTFWLHKQTGAYLDTMPDDESYWRRIDSPTNALRDAQRSIIDKVFAPHLDVVHPANFAYMPGKSIVNACEIHKDAVVSVKVDITNFFGNHKWHRLLHELQRLGYNERIAKYILGFTWLYGVGLPQGSLTAPIMSNVLNRRMDDDITVMSEEMGCTWSRYADDMVFSWFTDETDDTINQLLHNLSVVLRKYGFALNRRKTRIMRGKTVGVPCGFTIKNLPDDIRSTISSLFGTDWVNDTIRVAGGLPSWQLYEALRLLRSIPKLDIHTEMWYNTNLKKMLGVHFIDNELRLANSTLSRLKNEAMLYGLGVHNKPTSFEGQLSWVTKIDPRKGQKLASIVSKFQAKVGANSSGGNNGASSDPSSIHTAEGASGN